MSPARTAELARMFAGLRIVPFVLPSWDDQRPTRCQSPSCSSCRAEERAAKRFEAARAGYVKPREG